MFGQIIDLLVKQDEERRRISLLLLKIAFTIALATKVYLCLFGQFSVLSITDFQGIVNYFLTGKAIICFALFYLVWTVSYDFTSTILSFIGLWLTSKAYKFLSLLLKITPDEFKAEIAKSPRLKKYLGLATSLLNSTDIIEYENNIITPGTNFYKFYDYLLDIEDGKKTVSTGQFSSTIALIIQFIVIYNWFGLDFLSHSNWLLLLAIVILFLLFISNFFAYNFATLIDIKHSRLLNFLEEIEPSYEQDKLDRQSKNETTKP